MQGRSPSSDAPCGRGLLGAALATAFLMSCDPRRAATREFWVAAVPTRWNPVVNGQDAIHGTLYDPAQTIFPTVTYRRYTARLEGRPSNDARERRRGRRAHPRPAAARPRRRPAARPLQEPRHRSPASRTPCTSTASSTSPPPTAPTCPASPAATRRCARSTAGHLRADGRPRLRRRLVLPRPRAGDGRRRSRAGCTARCRSWTATTARPTASSSSFFTALRGFQTINGRAFVGNTPVFKARSARRCSGTC